jgi:hypothetical protein
MAANLGLIAHTAQGHTHKLAIGGPRNGLPKRGLTHTRGAYQTEDGRLYLIDPLLHGQVFKNALFDFLKAKVLLLEYVSAAARSSFTLLFLRQGRPTRAST